MHRSGTSAVTGATIRLGLAPPKTPLPPRPDNPAGFHESALIGELNHLILNALGRNWYHCLSFDPAMLDEAARAAAFDHCTAILRREFGDAPAFVVKDPLLCMTLPIWLPALHHLGAAVTALHVIRHPDEVAQSVYRRDMLPMALTMAVWFHHTLEAERMTRGMPRAFVFYDDFLRDWRACMARAGEIARIAWPSPGLLFRPDFGDVAIRSLRHHVAEVNSTAAGSPEVRALIDEALPVLRQLWDHPESPAALARIDDLRGRFAIYRRRFQR
jgi:hypothetical protein